MSQIPRTTRVAWLSLIWAFAFGGGLFAASVLSTSVILAQEKPADAPPNHGMDDKNHMQHMQGHEMHGGHDGGFMQGGMHHAVAKGVTLDQKIDEVAHVIILRVGPLHLPANTGHMKMPQPADLTWAIPMDGWLLAYHPKLVDANGGAVPGIVLHHVAFWNENRADFLCPNKEEHIFGAGSELTDWVQIPGFGYRVQKGDKIRIETMVHNPTGTAYDKAYLEIAIPYQESSGNAAIKNYYPAWIDAKSCGNSSYDLKPGMNEQIGNVTLEYSGILLGVGGHMHDYGKQLILEDVTRKETVATLDANLDEKGQLIGMPVKTFFEQGGYKLAAKDQLKVTSIYDNRAGKLVRDGAMGIVVGYFVPVDDAAMTGLRGATKAISHDMAEPADTQATKGEHHH